MSKVVVKGEEIPVDLIKPSPYQPRLTFDLEDIKGSIQRDGILVALTVRKKNGYYELIDGERRLRLAKELGYKTLPCDVVDIDDDTARRMVWKVNTLRKDYEPKEKAIFFKTMQEKYGMSLTGIAREYDSDRHTVKAYLNVFKLPDEYQQMVWDRVIPIGVVKELEVLFNSGRYLPLDRLTPEKAPEIFEILDRAVKEKYFGQKEVQEAIRPYLARFREERVKKAKEALAEVKPEVEVPKTPEEFEEAAKALREEAKRLKTPKQIHEEKRKKATKIRDSILSRLDNARELISVDEYSNRLKELEAIIEDEPDKALSGLRSIDTKLRNEIKKAREQKEKQRLEEEMKQKLEGEKKRIEKEALQKAEEKLLKEPRFIQKAAELAPIPAPERGISIPTTLSEEEAENLRQSLVETRERIRSILKDEDVKERGELFRNWLAHQTLLEVVGSSRCPICGADGKNLVWKCHGLNVEDALNIVHKKYQESLKGG